MHDSNLLNEKAAKRQRTKENRATALAENCKKRKHESRSEETKDKISKSMKANGKEWTCRDCGESKPSDGYSEGMWRDREKRGYKVCKTCKK